MSDYNPTDNPSAADGASGGGLHRRDSGEFWQGKYRRLLRAVRELHADLPPDSLIKVRTRTILEDRGIFDGE